MLIKTNKQRKVFSNARDVKRFNLDLESEYIEKIEQFDEDVEIGENNNIHHVVIKFPINKKQAIKNNVEYLEGFLCSDFKSLRTRAEMLTGFENNAQSLNYAIFNKETLAREDFQRKLKLSSLTKLFSLDIALKLFSNIKIKDINDNKKSDIDVFGYKEIIEINDARNNAINEEKNFNRLDLSGISLASTNKMSPAFGPFIKFQRNRIKSLSKKAKTKKSFKKLFNSYLDSGVDPAKLIVNSSYSSQSLNSMAKGRLQKNFKIQNSEENFASIFHEIVDTLVPESNKNYTLKRKKVSKKHEVIYSNIYISDNVLGNLNTEVFDVVVFAKNKKKRIIDYHVIRLDLEKLKKKKDLKEKCLVVLDKEKSGMVCKRSGNNKSIVKLIKQFYF